MPFEQKRFVRVSCRNFHVGVHKPIVELSIEQGLCRLLLQQLRLRTFIDPFHGCCCFISVFCLATAVPIVSKCVYDISMLLLMSHSCKFRRVWLFHRRALVQSPLCRAFFTERDGAGRLGLVQFVNKLRIDGSCMCVLLELIVEQYCYRSLIGCARNELLRAI